MLKKKSLQCEVEQPNLLPFLNFWPFRRFLVVVLGGDQNPVLVQHAVFSLSLFGVNALQKSQKSLHSDMIICFKARDSQGLVSKHI